MIENQKLARRIKEIFIESRATYGTRRIRKQLATQEISVSRKRVGRLMKQNQLCCKIKRKFKVTTDSKHRLPRKRRYLGRYFAHPMMQNRRAKRDDYKPSAVRVTQRYVP
ncbi:IS3 family transposase [Piscirickettsia salmonis]|uniref:IS3 family transposase n=1 Tax=Piscirickettsia salmonis TaxID=1238 RepID=UPI0009D66D4D|nr:IS3 family transposase [Piscirickettsia salmonis]QNR82636.1 transposase [Piscirickettsia salmonis]WGZ73347.1 transposase [Piscirickettsia salmonis]